MDRAILPALAVLALLLVAPEAPAAPCTVPRGHEIVAQSPEALVTATRTPPNHEGDRQWTGCLRATGRRTDVGYGYNGDKESFDVGGFVFAGEWVGMVAQSFYYVDGTTVYVVLADLRTGFVRVVATGVQRQRFPALALDAEGTAAWILEDGEERRVGGLVGGTARELDRGTRASIGAPAVGDGRIHWTRDGTERSVEAPVRCRVRAPERAVARSADAVVTTDGRRLQACTVADERVRTITARRTAFVRIEGFELAFVERTGGRERIALADLRTGVRWSGGSVRGSRSRLTGLDTDARGRVAWLRTTGPRTALLARDTRGRIRMIDRSVPRRARPHFTGTGDLRWTEGRRVRLKHVP